MTSVACASSSCRVIWLRWPASSVLRPAAIPSSTSRWSCTTSVCRSTSSPRRCVGHGSGVAARTTPRNRICATRSTAEKVYYTDSQEYTVNDSTLGGIEPSLDWGGKLSVVVTSSSGGPDTVLCLAEQSASGTTFAYRRHRPRSRERHLFLGPRLPRRGRRGHDLLSRYELVGGYARRRGQRDSVGRLGRPASVLPCSIAPGPIVIRTRASASSMPSGGRGRRAPGRVHGDARPQGRPRVMALGPDLARLQPSRHELLGAPLEPVWSYVSLTEQSEYGATEAEERARLASRGRARGRRRWMRGSRRGGIASSTTASSASTRACPLKQVVLLLPDVEATRRSTRTGSSCRSTSARS